MTDEGINFKVADIAGWRVAFPEKGKPHPETRRGGIMLPYRWVNERTHERRMDLPDYLQDANAVVGLLEKLHPRYWMAVRSGDLCSATVFTDGDGGMVKCVGVATTFCRAACLALLKANGVKVEDKAG